MEIIVREETSSGSTPMITSSDVTYFGGSNQRYLEFVVPLYQASVIGDWEIAESILQKFPELIRAGLNTQLDTTLHVAADSSMINTKKNLNFVKNLINKMTREELELQNQSSNTAFWIACSNGGLEIAKIMLEKNPSLLSIRGHNALFPLSASAQSDRITNKNTFKYLYHNYDNMTGDHWRHEDRMLTLSACVESEIFDVALQILADHPGLVAAAAKNILGILANKWFLFYIDHNPIARVIQAISRFFHMEVQCGAEEEVHDELKLLKIVWGDVCRRMNITEIEGMLRGPSTPLPDGRIRYSSRILFIAAKHRNTRFIVEVFRTYPDLMLHKNDDGLTIFHIAVEGRVYEIFNLLHEIALSLRNDIVQATDHEGNNMLHILGKTSKQMVARNSGAPLQMQRQLLWYLMVKRIMPQNMVEQKNIKGQTPFQILREETQELEHTEFKWIKDCMVVATLIITVAFTIAFTVPGGYRQETGIPFFIHKPGFLVFVIADAISLFSSITSLTIFLSVLVSRHYHFEFILHLPIKAMSGMLTLFISIAAMMIAFGASFFVLYHDGLKWVPILVIAFGAIPVIVFPIMQFRLFWGMFMYFIYIYMPEKHMLYPTNLRLSSNYPF